jgi:hypothetical protein
MNNLYKKQKKLEFNNKNLDKLYNCLSGNKWIKISNEKYKKFDYIDKLKGNGYFKAPGSYFSKGTWFFYERGMDLQYISNLDSYKDNKKEIILITVDEEQIYTITGKPDINPFYNNNYKKSFNKFKKKYVDGMIGMDGCYASKYDNYFCVLTTKKIEKNQKICKTLKKKIKCEKDKRCYWNNKYNNYNFRKMLKDGYNGFAINPYPGSDEEYFNNADLAFRVYDSESLALFNDKPVLKYYNIGTIGDIVSSCKGKKTVSKFINELCRRINIAFDE